MSDSDAMIFAATAAKMTDSELLDTWQTASEDEAEHPAGLLQAVIDEMREREIDF